MYIHCKQGFIEVDRWDGNAILTAPDHQAEITKLHRRKRGPVMVVRSRKRETIEGLLKGMRGKHTIWETPTWDYQFRVYLTATDFANVVARVLAEIDYRNFKSWTGRNAPGESRLAHDIWQVAFDAVRSGRSRFTELMESEMAAANQACDAKEEAVLAHGYSKPGVDPSKLTGLGDFVPGHSFDEER